MKIRATKSHILYKGRKIIFDSKLEANEARYLVGLEKKGVITNLVFQPKFQLQESFNVLTNKTKNGKSKQSSMTYTPDFSYTQGFDKVVVESKGFATGEYRMRKKMFLFRMSIFGVDVFIEKGHKYSHEYRLTREEKI